MELESFMVKFCNSTQLGGFVHASRPIHLVHKRSTVQRLSIQVSQRDQDQLWWKKVKFYGHGMTVKIHFRGMELLGIWHIYVEFILRRPD